ncbi:MAG: acyl carrier protein [Clostridia bacterium]|nr:acyl carrier protein [Clostridia bacterium]
MIYEKIKEILSTQFEVEENVITMDSDLTDDLGASSLDLVDLAMSIEDEFGIEVPDDLIETVKTVGDVVKFIEEN